MTTQERDEMIERAMERLHRLRIKEAEEAKRNPPPRPAKSIVTIGGVGEPFGLGENFRLDNITA